MELLRALEEGDIDTIRLPTLLVASLVADSQSIANRVDRAGRHIPY